jgi:hypothetical protein
VCDVIGMLIIPLLIAQAGSAELDTRAQAVVAAVAGYERSVASLWWTERHFLPPCEREEDKMTRREWKAVPEERFTDENWSWFLWQPASSPETAGADLPHRLLFGSAGLRVTCGFERREGMLALNDVFFAGGAHMGRLLGRSVDYERPMAGRSVEDLILRADTVEFVEPTPETPWPGVRAKTSDPARVFMDMEVRVDPALGGMPRVIFQRAHDGRLSSQTVVVEVCRVGDLWLPSVGLHGGFYRANVPNIAEPISVRRLLDIERARSGIGLPPEANTPQLRRWIERMTEIEVIDARQGLVRAPLLIDDNEPLVSPQVIVLDRVVLNRRLDVDELFDRLPADARMFNGCTGEWTDVEGIRRFWKGLHQ